MAKLSELSKEDRVVIARTSRFYNTGRRNPDDSVKGTVEVIGSISVSVRWDNGETNEYGDHDLDKISISSSGGTSELTRSPIIGKWYVNPDWSKGSLAKFRAIDFGGDFGYSESTHGNEVSKHDSYWYMGSGVRLATESELRTLPKSHPDHPDRFSSSYIPKTGDKVKVIDNKSSSRNKVGDIGIVGDVNPDNCEVKVEGKLGGGNYHFFSDLELISSSSSITYTFKAGDRVRIIANTNKHGFSMGATGYLRGSKSKSFRGGYLWNVEGIEKRISTNYVRECDMELATTSTSDTFKKGDIVKIIGNCNFHSNKIGDIGEIIEAKTSLSSISPIIYRVQVPGGPTYDSWTRISDMVKVDSSLLTTSKTSKPVLPSVDMSQYTQKHTYEVGEKVTVRLIKDLEEISFKPRTHIPLGTLMICDGKYFANPSSSSNLHPDNNKYMFNFPMEWFQVLGIHKKDMPTSSLDPITSSPKVWRVKTQQEMISEGLIPFGRIRPSSWNSSGYMDKYFGYIVPREIYPEIEDAGSSDYNIYMEAWQFGKNHFTTKPMPWNTSVVKDFSIRGLDSDEDPDDGLSWFDSDEEEDLDKLDRMSEHSSEVQVKRSKQIVEIIPHKSRTIF